MPASWPVTAGRDAYLAENGFDLAGYDAPYGEYPFMGVRIPVPSPPKRRWAVRLHDLHHVVTGYGTDSVGEAEVSAWELRRGLSGLGLYVGTIVFSAALSGLLLAPRRTLRAFRASGAGTSLFQRDVPYEALLDMPIAELRASLGVPAEGLSREPRRRHALAPP